MALSTSTALAVRPRNLLFLRTPPLWPLWPYLPLMRRRPGSPEECGVLYDVWRHQGRPGYSATIFLTNLFHLPPSLDAFLALPHEKFDTADEIFDAGWRID